MDKAVHSDPSEELDRFIAAYESAHAHEGQTDLVSFLPDVTHPLYREVLCELIRVELEFAWKPAKRPSLDVYLARFPQLAEDPKILGEILFEEYRLRRQAGESPVPEDYQRRFGVDVRDWGDRLPREFNGRCAAFELGGAPTKLAYPGEANPRTAKAAAALPEVGTEFLGFQLLTELGRGSFGRVRS